MILITVTIDTSTQAVVPLIPTEDQWGGLARSIVMWFNMERHTGAALFKHLDSSGVQIPQWLRDEVPDIDHVPPKGTVAAIVYRAMVSDAPPVTPAQDDLPALVSEGLEYFEKAGDDGDKEYVAAIRAHIAALSGVAVTAASAMTSDQAMAVAWNCLLANHPKRDEVVIEDWIIDAILRASARGSVARSADVPRPELLDKTLRQHAHERRISACSAWSDVREIGGGLNQAKCELAAANEAALKAAIDELADLSTQPAPADAWRCTQCGELPGIGPAWRWTGEIWQHHHADVGHVDARRFPEAPADARDAERWRKFRERDFDPECLRHTVSDDCHPPRREFKHGSDLDSAIDAAIAAMGGV